MALCLASKQPRRCQKWGTPPDLLAVLDEQYCFTRNPDGTLFDPCPIDWDASTHPCGLAVDWAPRTFVNPPYTGVADWVRKASAEAARGKLVVLLLNACTDSVWFHTYCYNRPGVELRFLRGRVPFVDPQNPCSKVANPTPSVIVVFSPS